MPIKRNGKVVLVIIKNFPHRTILPFNFLPTKEDLLETLYRSINIWKKYPDKVEILRGYVEVVEILGIPTISKDDPVGEVGGDRQNIMFYMSVVYAQDHRKDQKLEFDYPVIDPFKQFE